MDENKGHLPWENLAQLAEGHDTLTEAQWRHLGRCRECVGAYTEAVRYRSAWLHEPQSFTVPVDLQNAAGAIAEPGSATDRARPANTGRQGRSGGGLTSLLSGLLPQRRALATAMTVTATVAATIALLAVILVVALQQRPTREAEPLAPLRLAMVEASAAGMILPGIEAQELPSLPAYRSGLSIEDKGLRTALTDLANRRSEEPENQDLAFWLVAGNLAAGQIDNAGVFARQARQAFPEDDRLPVLEAIIAYRRSELDRAEELLRAAILRNPDDGVARFNLAILLRERGGESEARLLLQRNLGTGTTVLDRRARAVLDSLGS
jgi:Flp pilus assembly protein TadD